MKIINNLIWIFSNLLFLTIGILFSNNENLYLILSAIGFVQLIISIYIYIRDGNKFLSLIVIYDIVMYMFLFGQCLMWLVTENYDGRSILKYYSKDAIVNAQIFTLFSLFFFHLAAINVKRKKNKKIEKNSEIWNKSLCIAGIIIVVFSIIPEIVFNIRIFNIAYSQGYMGIYSNQVGSLFQKFLNLREFFLPGLILVLIGDFKSNRYKLLKKILLFIVIIDVFIEFYVGSRSDALMQCLTLMILFFVFNNKKINVKVYIKYAVIFTLLLVMTNVVRTVRVDSHRNINTYIEAVSISPDNSLIIELLGEMGGSMSTCIETMLLVPSDFNYRYGTSYLYSFTWLLPKFIGGNLSLNASMNNWIDTVRYTGSGWGFSTTGEAYFNFGYYGCLMFLIFGFFVGKYFKGIDNMLLENNPVELALSFVLFSRLLIFSRIDFLSTLPSIFYFYICIKLFIIFIFNYIKRRTKE